MVMTLVTTTSARGGARRGGARRASRARRSSIVRRALSRDNESEGQGDGDALKSALRLRRASDGAWALSSVVVRMRRATRGRRVDDANERQRDWDLGTEKDKRNENLERSETLSVCAMVHYGEREYFDWVSATFAAKADGATLCELVTSEKNLTNANERGVELRQLACALAPTEEARELARAHGLRAQLDAMDARANGWFIADVTREELLAMRKDAGEIANDGRTMVLKSTNAVFDGKTSVVNAGNLPPALEALVVTATGRASSGDPVRLFTRASCWFVPCPEAHLLLLDWVWGGGRPSNVLGALVDCCAAGEFEDARKLAFAQMIVSAQATGPVGGGTTAPILVQKRNIVAMDGVGKALDAGVKDVALLYGGLHVNGLVEMARERFDFEIVNVEWRDAWRVKPPANESPLRYAIVPLLLFIDGTDWAQTLHDVVSLDSSSALLALFLYIIRHGGLYYALGKWLLEWNTQLFETAEDGLNAPTSVN